MRNETRPVLVTGSNRSGTTWLGRMLCHARQHFYLHEPFNPQKWPRYFAQPIPYRNLYVCAENAEEYAGAARAIAHGRVPLRANARDVGTPRHAAKITREAVRSLSRAAGRRPPLVKDPIALFSAEWLAASLDAHVVVAIRNPVAYAGSLKRLDWRFDFHNWLDQPLLLRDHLAHFAGDVAAMGSARHDIVDEAIVQWNCHYHVVNTLRSRHPDWHFVDHDVIAENPADEFAHLYAALGLRFDERARVAIARDSAPGNVQDAPQGDRGPVRRDSRATRHTWRSRLSDAEVDRVRRGTAAVASHFFGTDTESEWMR